MDAKAHVIVVERERGIAARLERMFDGAVVRREASLDHALERCEQQAADVLIVTSQAFRADHGESGELLEVIAAKVPGIHVLCIVEAHDMTLAYEALRDGTCEYTKFPIGDDELRLLVENALNKRPRRVRSGRGCAPAGLLGRSRAMQDVYRHVRQAAATDIPVLILGETGTGKDLAAQAIHRQSARREGPYVPVHLGALPSELVAGELFGHERGAFTGAVETRAGKFEEAHKGTIFLDEIATIAPKVQVSLLRLIEQQRFTRLGGRRPLSSDVRIVAASNENLSELAAAGKFREDLFYRLDVFHVVMPPLRERVGDVPLLAGAFMERYSAAFKKDVRGIAPECITRLEDYAWPGNVRELKNVVQRAILVCTGDVLLPEHLPARFRPERVPRPAMTFELGTPLERIEREVILRALATARTRTDAASLLGISRRSLYNKLRRHGIK